MRSYKQLKFKDFLVYLTPINICIIIIIYFLITKLIKWLYNNFIGPYLRGPKITPEKLGPWAVICGATDSIGIAYAKAFAKRHFKLVLIGPNMETLKKTKNSVYKCMKKNCEDVLERMIHESLEEQTILIDVDFRKDKEACNKIRETLTSLENLFDFNVGILVNNVHMHYTYPEFFTNIPITDDFLHDIVTCNINSVTYMCRLFLPAMILRRKGVIINISSMASKIPYPMLSLYSASKAFINKFSEDLQYECKKYEIIIQNVMPGFDVSLMTKIGLLKKWNLSIDNYIESAIKRIGYIMHTNGNLIHNIIKFEIIFFKIFLGDLFIQNYLIKNLCIIQKNFFDSFGNKPQSNRYEWLLNENKKKIESITC